MRRSTIIPTALTWVLLSVCGHAALADGASRRWAIVIGVDKYLDSSIQRLRFCAADATLVAETLVKHCGYDARDVLVLTDNQKEAALRPLRKNLAERLPALLAKAEPGDTVLVYFSGHGFLDDRGEAYLAPQDCQRDKLGLTGLRTDELRNQLRQCKAVRKLLVLDCCHAGGTRGEAAGGPSGQEVGSAFREAQGLVTLASCRKAEQSHEWTERGHGLFSYYLADGLGGAADRDGDGIVDSDELYRYVFDQVTTAARKELNVRQTPVRLLGDEESGVFALARVTGRASTPPRPAMSGITPRPAPEQQGPQEAATLQVRFESLGALAGSSGPAAFSPDGSIVATCGPTGPTGGVVLWDVKTRDDLASLKSPRQAASNQACASVLGFSRDGKRLVTTPDGVGNDATLELWNVDTQKFSLCRGYLDDRGRDEYHHSCFTPDGRIAYVRSYYNRARSETHHYLMLWDMDTGKETTLSSDKSLEKISDLAASPDGKTLALGDSEGNIVLFDIATRGVRTTFSAHGSSVYALFFAPKGDVLASNSFEDASLRLWDPASGKKGGMLKLDREGVYQKVVFHPSGKFLATSCGPILIANSNDRKPLSLWDLRTRKPLAFDGLDAMDPLAFSDDGAMLAALAADGSGVGLWRVHLEDR